MSTSSLNFRLGVDQHLGLSEARRTIVCGPSQALAFLHAHPRTPAPTLIDVIAFPNEPLSRTSSCEK